MRKLDSLYSCIVDPTTVVSNLEICRVAYVRFPRRSIMSGILIGEVVALVPTLAIQQWWKWRFAERTPPAIPAWSRALQLSI